jgi:hypothetical protein
MILSWLIRIHLAWPNWPIPLLDRLSATVAPAGVVTPEYYLSLLTKRVCDPDLAISQDKIDDRRALN